MLTGGFGSRGRRQYQFAQAIKAHPHPLTAAVFLASLLLNPFLRGHCLSHCLPTLGDKQISALSNGHQETSHIATVQLAYAIIPAH